MNNSGFTSSTVLLAFLAGAASGAVVALLLAPKSGRETRNDIRLLGSGIASKVAQVPNAVRAAYDSASSAAVTAYNENINESGGNGPAHA